MYLISTGMVCPVGLHSEAACAAIRAGISGFAELPYRDNAGDAIIGAIVPGLDPELRQKERLIQLLEKAIQECIKGVDPVRLAGMPLLISLAEPELPGGSAALADNIIPEIERRLDIRFLERGSRAIATGRTAGFEALQGARELFESNGVKACLICGVGSNVNARTLHWFDRNWRLKTEQNSDGLIPGEAAAAVILQIQPDTGSTAKIIGLGFATEEASVMTEEPPLLGLGLTEAATVALSQAGLHMNEIGFRISDVTGECYGFREQSLVVGRLLRVHREEGYAIWHPSECIGDTGAAAGIIQLIMVFNAFKKGYAPGELAMCFTSSDLGKRAVAVLASNALKKVGSET